MAKVMGSLAMKAPKHGDVISGILVKRNFNYYILAPQDLSGTSRNGHFRMCFLSNSESQILCSNLLLIPASSHWTLPDLNLFSIWNLTTNISYTKHS